MGERKRLVAKAIVDESPDSIVNHLPLTSFGTLWLVVVGLVIAAAYGR